MGPWKGKCGEIKTHKRHGNAETPEAPPEVVGEVFSPSLSEAPWAVARDALQREKRAEGGHQTSAGWRCGIRPEQAGAAPRSKQDRWPVGHIPAPSGYRPSVG